MTINEFMTKEHRDCDNQFANLENIIDSGNFDGGKIMFDEFISHMLKHFTMEEEVMFKEFNDCEGGGCNPTGVMLIEHEQMRSLFSQ